MVRDRLTCPGRAAYFQGLGIAFPAAGSASLPCCLLLPYLGRILSRFGSTERMRLQTLRIDFNDRHSAGCIYVPVSRVGADHLGLAGQGPIARSILPRVWIRLTGRREYSAPYLHLCSKVLSFARSSSPVGTQPADTNYEYIDQSRVTRPILLSLLVRDSMRERGIEQVRYAATRRGQLRCSSKE